MVHKLFRSMLAGLHQPALFACFRSPAPSFLACALWPRARGWAQAQYWGGPASLRCSPLGSVCTCISTSQNVHRSLSWMPCRRLTWTKELLGFWVFLSRRLVCQMLTLIAVWMAACIPYKQNWFWNAERGGDGVAGVFLLWPAGLSLVLVIS